MCNNDICGELTWKVQCRTGLGKNLVVPIAAEVMGAADDCGTHTGRGIRMTDDCGSHTGRDVRTIDDCATHARWSMEMADDCQ